MNPHGRRRREGCRLSPWRASASRVLVGTHVDHVRRTSAGAPREWLGVRARRRGCACSLSNPDQRHSRPVSASRVGTADTRLNPGGALIGRRYRKTGPTVSISRFCFFTCCGR